MNQQERYEHGHFAGPNVGSVSGPKWAQKLGWDGYGMWVVVKKDDILSAIPGLNIQTYWNIPCYLCIAEIREFNSLGPQFFHWLEDKGYNLLAHADNLKLTGEATMLVREQTGGYSLCGVFTIEGTWFNNPKPLAISASGRLFFGPSPGDVTLPFDTVTVPPFTVSASITMNASILSAEVDEWKTLGFNSGSADAVFLNASPADHTTPKRQSFAHTKEDTLATKPTKKALSAGAQLLSKKAMSSLQSFSFRKQPHT